MSSAILKTPIWRSSDRSAGQANLGIRFTMAVFQMTGEYECIMQFDDVTKIRVHKRTKFLKIFADISSSPTV